MTNASNSRFRSYKSISEPTAVVISVLGGLGIAAAVGAALSVGVIFLGAIQYGFSSEDSTVVDSGEMPSWVNPGIWVSVLVAIAVGTAVGMKNYRNTRRSAPRNAGSVQARIEVLRLEIPRLPSSPRDFEYLTSEWLLAWGCKGVQVTPASSDGGIDVFSDELLGQCKMLSTKKVGRPELQKLFGAGSAVLANRSLAFFAWSEGYTSHAIEYAKNNCIALFSFDGVSGLFWTMNHHASDLLRRLPSS